MPGFYQTDEKTDPSSGFMEHHHLHTASSPSIDERIVARTQFYPQGSLSSQRCTPQSQRCKQNPNFFSILKADGGKTMELVSLKQLFQRLGNGGRLLGLDVGSRNIGLAVSDAKCRIASPHSVMYRSQTTTLQNISRLENLVQEMNITGLVIGYPLELTGFQGKQGAQVKLFAKELQLSGRFSNLAYLYWDERLTSVAVTNVIGSMDITRRRRKNIIDKMSALCILQGCLDSLSRLENGTHEFAPQQL